MKKQIISILFICAFGMTLIVSCKKDEKEETPTLDSQTQQFNNDANNYKSESDQADDDINNSLRDYPAFGKVTGVATNVLCGVTIDTSQIMQKILTFNFDGSVSCFIPARKRSGAIKVELISGAHWSDVNAVLKLTYINFKIVRVSDNKSVMFNGVKTLKNLNGNNWLGFLFGTATLKYQERAFNIAVTFDNASATWNTAHITEWSYTPVTQKITFTAIGDTSLNGYSNVNAWGVNRFGNNFTTNYNSQIVSNTLCGLWSPVSGELIHHVNNAVYTLTLGVDSNGNPINSGCAYGYKVAWTSTNGAAGSVILSY